MIRRHSPFYIHAVSNGKLFKTSNRNDVLLGQEEFVKNSYIDEASQIVIEDGIDPDKQQQPGTKEWSVNQFAQYFSSGGNNNRRKVNQSLDCLKSIGINDSFSSEKDINEDHVETNQSLKSKPDESGIDVEEKLLGQER